jgi:hypothetical protein
MKSISTVLLAVVLLAVSPVLAYDPLAIDKASPASAPEDFTVKDAERDREIPLRFYLPSQKAIHHRIILALSTAFWDAYLCGDPQAHKWLEGDGPRSVLDGKDRWQRK